MDKKLKNMEIRKNQFPYPKKKSKIKNLIKYKKNKLKNNKNLIQNKNKLNKRHK
jgi:hypothetical protein